MGESTILVSGQITPTDAISVELVKPDGMPAAVRLAWPLQPTVCEPRRFPDTAAAIVRLFAEASTALAGIKARRRL